jgi:hypothetical protein
MIEVLIAVVIVAMVMSLGSTASTVVWDKTGSETANDVSRGLLVLSVVVMGGALYAVLVMLSE